MQHETQNGSQFEIQREIKFETLVNAAEPLPNLTFLI